MTVMNLDSFGEEMFCWSLVFLFCSFLLVDVYKLGLVPIDQKKNHLPITISLQLFWLLPMHCLYYTQIIARPRVSQERSKSVKWK